MPITNASLSLPAEVSQEIVSNAIQESAVMQLARQVALPGHGAVIPVITGDPTAYFVDEGQVKANADAKLETKTMKGRTIAIIEPFSNQFRDDSSALYDELVARLPMLLAQKFDEQVFHGDAVTGFDTLKDASAVSLDADAWAGLVTCRETVEAADGELNGFAMSNQGITRLLSEKDGNGRPLFTAGVEQGEFGTLIGVPVTKAKRAYKKDTKNVLGFAGDWTKALFGVVRDVTIDIADQATLTTTAGTLNLFERNMFAVRAEMEVGFVCAQAGQFVKVTA